MSAHEIAHEIAHERYEKRGLTVVLAHKQKKLEQKMGENFLRLCPLPLQIDLHTV